MAIALGLIKHQTIKTLIFETNNGEQVLVIVGVDQSVISSSLRKVVGSRNIQLANPENVFQATVNKNDSIPPFS